jgi:hypothetical protein
MPTNTDSIQLHVEGPDGDDEVTLPAGLVEMLAEGDQNAAEVVGDLALFGCAQRIHATVHHQEGEVDPDLEAIEETTMDLFEERFGMSYGQATGHQH